LLNYYFSLCAILEWALTYVNLIYETSSNPLRWSEVSKICQKSADVCFFVLHVYRFGPVYVINIIVQ